MDTPYMLVPFLRDYLAWAEADAPTHPVFNDDFGLCMNHTLYCEQLHNAHGAKDFYHWLPRQFPPMACSIAGEDPILNSYPFEYDENAVPYPDVSPSNKHKNPRRIAWIKAYLEAHDVSAV